MKTNGAPPSSEEGKRSAAGAPDPEVTAKATRRRFTAAYKLSIIEKADACETPGEIGRLLRREGLYSSHLSGWRKAAREGSLRELGKKRGPMPSGGKREAKKVRKLERGERAAAGGTPEGAHHHRCPGKSCGAAGREPRGREALLSAARGLAGHVGVRDAAGRGRLSVLGPGISHDGQVHGAAPGRPGRHAVAGPPQGLERQPVLGGALQDHQVPPGLPGSLRQHRRREGLLPGVLPVVQHRAPAERTGRGLRPLAPTASWEARRGPPNSRTRSGSTAHSPSRRPMAQSRPTGEWRGH